MSVSKSFCGISYYTTNLYYALLLCGCPNLRNQSGAKLCGKNLYGCQHKIYSELLCKKSVPTGHWVAILSTLQKSELEIAV